MGQEDNVTSNTYSGTDLRLPIGAVLGLLGVLTIAFYSKIESDRVEVKSQHAADKLEVERDMSELRALLRTKADKTEAADRWTASQQESFGETLEERHRTLNERLESYRRENTIHHEALKSIIDHIDDDVGECKRELKIE